MTEFNLENFRAYLEQIVSQSLDRSDPTGWFETLYARAGEEPSKIPWAMMQPHPDLEDWLHGNSPPTSNKSAIVTGCGLGDDAEAIALQGYGVSAFDISPSAIAWCRKRFAQSRVNYLVADLFDLEAAWEREFDLVYSSRTIQSLPLTVRSRVIDSIASLVAPGGTLLIITQTRDSEAEPDGPPWPLSKSELARFEKLGFEVIGDRVDRSTTYPTRRVEYQLTETT